MLRLPAFVLYLNRFQIEAEERALEARFGDDYRRFAAAVRRWLQQLPQAARRSGRRRDHPDAEAIIEAA